MRYTLFAFLLFFLTGCVKDPAEISPAQRDDNTITIGVTRGLISGNGSENSAKVEKIRIIAFDAVTRKAEVNLFTGNSTLTEESSTNNTESNFTISLPSKEYLLYVIANETAGMNLGTATDYYAADAAAIALGSYTETTVPMGKVVKIKVLPDPDDSKKAVVQVWNGTDWGAQTKQVGVKLERLHARTRLFVRKSVDKAVTITGVELVRVAPQSWFAAKSTSAVGTSTVSGMMAASVSIANVATDAQIAKSENEIFADYTVGGFSPITLTKNIFPENLLTHSLNKEENATALHITYTYGSGSDQKTINAYVPLRNGTTGTDYRILRNRSYDIYATVDKKSTDISIDIPDWDEVPVSGDIYGADFKVNKTIFTIPHPQTDNLTMEASDTIKFEGYATGPNATPTTDKPSGLGFDFTFTPALNNNNFGTSKTGEVAITSSSTASKTCYLWFKAGNIKKRIKVSNVNPDDYVFEVTSPAPFSYLGGTNQYKVTSYKKGTPNTAAAWTATHISTDGGKTWTELASAAKPAAWVTAFQNNGAGSVAATGYDVTVNPLDPDGSATVIPSRDDILQNAAPVGSAEKPYNLSNQSGGGATVQNTANCYVINNPGSYSLPLVYGNAIKNGVADTTAYTSTATGTTILKRFINHAGKEITDPYICNNIGSDNKKLIPAGAKIVWQDASGLIQTVALSADKKSLVFTTSSGNAFVQGNAVIAVTDGANGKGNVLWSWHIWVTDYKLGSDDRTFYNATKNAANENKGIPYTFMPINLGWCSEATNISVATYTGRAVQVRFTQDESGKTQDITISQPTARPSSAESGNSCYYQWGRKDPFVGKKPDTSTGDKDDPSTALWSTGNTCITSGICNPDTYCTNDYMDSKYYNLWSANNTTTTNNDNAVVKTVYDPSPAGYHLPASNAFTGFTTASPSAWDTTSKSWDFAKNGSTTVNFPAVGWRAQGVSTVSNVGMYSRYWLAVPNSQGGGYDMYFGSGFVNSLDKSFRTYGYPVRPVKD